MQLELKHVTDMLAWTWTPGGPSFYDHLIEVAQEAKDTLAEHPDECWICAFFYPMYGLASSPALVPGENVQHAAEDHTRFVRDAGNCVLCGREHGETGEPFPFGYACGMCAEVVGKDDRFTHEELVELLMLHGEHLELMFDDEDEVVYARWPLSAEEAEAYLKSIA